MNDLAFLEDWLTQPEPGAIEAKSAASSILDKPIDSGPVTINAGGFVPEEPAQAKQVNKPLGKTAKESILPQVRKVADTKEKAATILSAAVPDISEAPVPTGGVGLLLFIALIIVFAITPSDPTDPKSPARLKLLWGSILGNYSYKKTVSPTISGSSSKSSGGYTSPDISSGMAGLIQGGLYS